MLLLLLFLYRQRQDQLFTQLHLGTRESFTFLVPDSHMTVGQRQASSVEHYKHSVCVNEPHEALWRPDLRGAVTGAAVQRTPWRWPAPAAPWLGK